VEGSQSPIIEYPEAGHTIEELVRKLGEDWILSPGESQEQHENSRQTAEPESHEATSPERNRSTKLQLAPTSSEARVGLRLEGLAENLNRLLARPELNL